MPRTRDGLQLLSKAGKAKLLEQMVQPDTLHMGHEQLDTKTHFSGQV